MTIPLLILCPIAEHQLGILSQRFDVTYAITDVAREQAIRERGQAFRAVLTIGTIGLSGEEIAAMPKLELVSCMGAGYETVDAAAARARGIVMTNGRGANDDCVADHAMGMLIAVVRNFRKLDQQCRAGVWRTQIPVPPGISGKRLGILGMGAIGEKIATRAQGFGLRIGYHNRNPKPGSAHPYFDSLTAMAEWCDVLLCVAPGGASTRHLVNAELLRALGPRGYLLNLGRGSIVDTAALAAALSDGVIAGAGLDVYESEPEPPAELLALDNLLLTPHVGGWSPESEEAQFTIYLQNLEGHFSGRGVVTPV
ncbi:2-hydroxyacid dehydrogenase [Achromobacter sp. AONIH1]|uniref:2-hydroxyacid dehydrogenase n=1 Tax=Achromobacter sp. AONIH1 TaxID=1758194 RepID=UPI000CD2C2C2|nr:2-hydroxyacid dehydrogenase [Achromobacter sp. AONIH1]AUT48139.1 hydroxyacid dehydrogenase [Achromobacter sp. AONIH1]